MEKMEPKPSKAMFFFFWLAGMVLVGIAFGHGAQGNTLVASICGGAGAYCLSLGAVEAIDRRLNNLADALKKELESIKKELSAAEEK